MTKAMILAAGRGERMQHLTAATPKPLLEVAGRPLIEYHLHALKKAGVKDVVINVAYYSEQIIQKIGDGSRFDLIIHYSVEGEGPIGTGKGIQKALPLLGEEPFILISADIWTDYSLINLKQDFKGDAHLILVDNPDYHENGDFGLTAQGLLTPHEPRYTYANIAIMRPQFFMGDHEVSAGLGPMLFAAAEKGDMSGEYYSGQWFNVGTPKELERATRHALDLG